MDEVLQRIQKEMNNFQWGTSLAKYFYFWTRKKQ